MLKQLFEVVRSRFLLSHDLQQNRREIEEVRRELPTLQDGAPDRPFAAARA